MFQRKNVKRELEYAGPPSDSMPDGEYIVECIGSDQSRRIGRLFLRFQIVEDGPEQGKATFKSYNISKNGKIRPQSKYYADWSRIHGSRPSKKGVQMSPRIFHGRFFKVKIVTKYLRDYETNKPTISDDTRYSYAEEILETYEKP